MCVELFVVLFLFIAYNGGLFSCFFNTKLINSTITSLPLHFISLALPFHSHYHNHKR